VSRQSNPLDRIELLQGTLDLIILQTLLWGPRHGYGIAQFIKATSEDLLQVDTGSLYPALHRLEGKGWIAAEWTVSENRQRAREYSLTKQGRLRLTAERKRWARLADVMSKLLESPRESQA
jgi:transcriptional regulator